MNYLKLFPLGLLFIGVSQTKAQKESPKKADNPIACKNIKEGKFMRANYPEAIYYMTIKDNVQTEYLNNGKDFIKSTLVFIDDCNYKAIVLEKSNESFPAKVGDVFNNKIVETYDNFVKIHTKIDNSQFEVVYAKVKVQ